MARCTSALTRDRAPKIAGFAGAIGALHLAGWGLFVHYSRHEPALAGLGALAYVFGLRHAFDVDHVAAIDNTTRKLVHDGKRPLGTGFFFGLGHSTVVFALSAALALGASTVRPRIPTFRHWGGYLGTSVSGLFLCAIGVLNAIVLLDILRISRDARRGVLDEARLEQRLLERGFVSRFLGRFARRVGHSWQLYPIGMLFGLGFDTATEVGLLTVSAGVATEHVPFLAVLSLPLLFAAGMCLMDTADGAFVSHAYRWAFSNPRRRLHYNITITSLSAAVALLVGTVELLQVLSAPLDAHDGFLGRLRNLGFDTLGYGVVGLFLVTWVASVLVWRTRRAGERWAGAGISPGPVR